ncbi:hypothetical protein J2128_002328 [Methanomicrobium sp. W14]|nr:hypothetical protein [Methanomicrobium sp. W14]
MRLAYRKRDNTCKYDTTPAMTSPLDAFCPWTSDMMSVAGKVTG